MASRGASTPAKHLFNGFKSYQHHRQPCLARTMATESTIPNATLSQTYADAHLESAPTEPILKDDTTSILAPTLPPRFQPQRNPFITTTQCTLHAFPSLEPTGLVTYPSTHLLLPLRKDILHRAVIYEADGTRQGTANTKTRYEVHGSNRKIRPQKGTGKARLGDKKSPMLRGGGVAFGPKPRDFATDLPEKIYDLAWRTALSYRYKKGELILLDDSASIPADIHRDSLSRYMRDMLRYNRMGHADGRTLFITKEKAGRESLFHALEGETMGRDARALEVGDVDVKDLLELGRVVVERSAFEVMLRAHEEDLVPERRLGAWKGVFRAEARVHGKVPYVYKN